MVKEAEKYLQLMDRQYYKSYGKVVKVVGLTIESVGPKARMGDLCKIYPNEKEEEYVIAEVVGFQDSRLILMPVDSVEGVGTGCVVENTGHPLSVLVGEELLGHTLDGIGRMTDGTEEIHGSYYPLENTPPDPMDRRIISEVLPLGVKAVDGLITDEPGLVLSTFYADCVPLYVVDPVHRAIGMSHSGWRGTAARMGAVTLSAMQEAYGTRPEDVVCAVGPSICKDCYEVSADVADIFAEEFPGHEQEILAESEKNSVGMAHADKKYQLDLWKANEIIFQEAGVRKEHLAVTDICTCCNPKLLFSHRASHGKRGNLGGFLYLK